MKKMNFTEQETQQPPQVSIKTNQGPYTLVMIDPDAGKKTKNNKSPGNSDKYYLHWLVVNIPPGGNVHEGEVIVPYAGPTPPAGTGQHRYHFVLYQQSQGNLMNGLNVHDRPNWSLQGFLSGKGLQELARQTIRVPQA